ncbi:MAG: [Fe-Fe] hydrogenase large subunit C-terminal domain-containing protein [Eubacteriales bacterium]|nr:[Fe-Fe] hydrogenase large subunit C-terminal domain-containing protein [Eubacteriales bacterium]
MTSFKSLYHQLVHAALEDQLEERLNGGLFDPYDDHQLDCLLHPEKHPVVWRVGPCTCSSQEQKECAGSCPFDAIEPNHADGIHIDAAQCLGCAQCVQNCKAEKLTASRDIIPALKAVRSSKTLVYALVAPAFLGQFGPDITPGKLRNALKAVGFDGMLEVALFADILTLKEALEFDANIHNESDYQLTSCCCPMWIAMIRKVYRQLVPHVPASVSPMVACGRTVKHLHPDAVTVFIGPCMAKKAEAREKDLAGAVDYVLTFQEMQDIFDALDIDPTQMQESDRDHSSRLGRIYARAGGVSEAVQSTVERLNPHRDIAVRTQRADGVPACKAMLSDVLSGKVEANFYEGMGCVGGCVGGPKALLPTAEGAQNIDQYGDRATYPTPIDNPYVIELLSRLGFDHVEQLLQDSEIFSRYF